VKARENKTHSDRVYGEDVKLLPGFLAPLLRSLNAHQAKKPESAALPVSHRLFG
jgi:hypothetical protein